MDAQARLDGFKTRMDSYFSSKHLYPAAFNPDFTIADTLSVSDMDQLTQNDCFNYSFQLCQYADYVGFERAEVEGIARWCENSLNMIIASQIDEMAGEYLKYEIKVAKIVRNDLLASKVNEWLLEAQARLEPLKNREYNIRKKADILIEKGKRK